MNKPTSNQIYKATRLAIKYLKLPPNKVEDMLGVVAEELIKLHNEQNPDEKTIVNRAKFAILDNWRKEQRQPHNIEVEYYLTNNIQPQDYRARTGPERHVDNRDYLIQRLDDASDLEQQIIYLRYYKGKTYREIGRKLGISFGGVCEKHKEMLERVEGKSDSADY